VVKSIASRGETGVSTGPSGIGAAPEIGACIGDVDLRSTGAALSARASSVAAPSTAQTPAKKGALFIAPLLYANVARGATAVCFSKKMKTDLDFQRRKKNCQEASER
jgi:hypothetical protein